MGRLQVTVTILALVVAVSACDASEGEPLDSPGEPLIELPGTSWVLVSIGGTEPVLPGEATLAFDADGQASGTTGCNRWNASYSLDGTSLTFGPMATTKMACDEPRMQLEATFLELMGDVTGYAGADGTLVLRGSTDLIFEPQGPSQGAAGATSRVPGERA